ncbi:aminotransferase class V-fold PLP-dependent enzyme [Salisediminibacterium halotolerans]|uniref:aminotransferase class V-fold PLP-dependent enzyme n=1 Tax=Salisediminibacterium halotolerans TaxID=517425 RepID=UPI000B889A1C|nr:aminotransferase class V-fold PLP-dependent enzyme [Salisediminibacterium haloalkalitolerans]
MQERIKALRDRLWDGIQTVNHPVSLNGHVEKRLPNTLNVNFEGVQGADLLRKLHGVAASTGSACHTGSVELSPVLEAMNVSVFAGMGAIRFSLGRYTTENEIDRLLAKISAQFDC